MRRALVGLACFILIGCGMAPPPTSRMLDGDRAEVFKSFVGAPELDAGMKKVSDMGDMQIWERTFAESELRQLGLKEGIFEGPVLVELRAEPSRRLTMKWDAMDKGPTFKFIYKFEDGPKPNSTIASIDLETDFNGTVDNEEAARKQFESNAGTMLQKAVSRYEASQARR